MPDSSNNFLETLSEGKQQHIVSIYKEVFPKIKRFVLNNNGTLSDAEDIFQKALLQIIVRYRKEPFHIKSSFENYFFTVCSNLWRRELNNYKPTTNNPEVLKNISEEQDAACAIVEQERYELFSDKLSTLSENCRQILKLFFAKTSYQTIMQKLNYNSENVVRQRIFKCKKRLIDLIKKDKRYNNLKDL